MAAGDLLTVLFANNYDMARARAGWQAGTYPAHHLYGTAELGEGFQVVDLPFSGVDRAARLTRLTRHQLGDLGQEIAAIRARGRVGGGGRAGGGGGAIVYGAAAQELRGLATLRAARAFSTPVVGVFHSPPESGRLRAGALRGFDRAIALTERTRQGMLEAGIAPERITVLGWGPDLDFHGFGPRPPAAPDAPIVATGKTGRDMRTLLAALRETGLAARVYGEREQLARLGPILDQVSVRPVAIDESSAGPLRYDEGVMADMRAAALIAIPLSSTERLTGLTEVVDALACGRPMILTRSPYFDFDIEQIGCGWWAQPGDVRGWIELLRTAVADRERLDRMGRAGRAWAEGHFNARLFTDGVKGVLLDAISS